MGQARRHAQRRLADRRGAPTLVEVRGGGDECVVVVPGVPAGDVAVAVADAVSRRVDAPPASPLSPREAEVARLVARGLSNREIAAALVIGEDTVKKHVSHALAKLDLHNRTGLALIAAQLFPGSDRLT